MNRRGCQAFLAYILPDAIAARQSDGCSAVVAEWENELIGVLELREFSHISMFFVDPEFQCGGIGRRLLTRAVTLIRKSAPGTRGTDGVRRSTCRRSLPPSRIHGRRPGNGRIRVRFTPMRLKLR
ncbi:MAG: GNAT family N-acetyltransferase [Lentisphaeria bacterium]|nr:MAG: GNAT family N-acetyltransferase [Lentisphaeria bacterium]